jgi:hypothetical protein
MFDTEATVTAATPTELTLTADWPIRWLEAAEGFEIQRKVVLKEILPEFDGTVKRLEIKSDRARWPNLCVGDQVIVRCFVEGESRSDSVEHRSCVPRNRTGSARLSQHGCGFMIPMVTVGSSRSWVRKNNRAGSGPPQPRRAQRNGHVLGRFRSADTWCLLLRFQG